MAVIQAMQLGKQASHTLQTMTTAAMGARAMAVARPAVDSTEARSLAAGASHRERCRPLQTASNAFSWRPAGGRQRTGP